MASSRRTAVNENIETYDSAGGKDRATLVSWEQAKDIDIVAAQQSEILEIYRGLHVDNDIVDGAITDSSYFRIIRAASGEGHMGIPKTDGSIAAFSKGNLPYTIRMDEDNFQLQDLYLENLNDGGDANPGAIDVLRNIGQIIVGCMAKCTGGGTTSNGFKFNTFGGGATAYLINSLPYDCTSRGISILNGCVLYAYNCTTHGSGNGITANAGTTANSKNCIFNEGLAGDGTHIQTTNSTGQANVFIDAAGKDFRLASIDTTARDQGTYLGDDAIFPFDDDVLGFLRSGDWDIGFHEYLASKGIFQLGMSLRTE